MKIAAQLYTIRDFTGNAGQVEESLKKIRGIGYRAVQVSGFKHYDAALIAGVCKSIGLEIAVTHTPLARIIDDTENVINEHKLFGAGYVGLGSYKMQSQKDCADFIKLMEKPVERFYKAGLKFVYHNHAHEFVMDGGMTVMDYFLQNTDPRKTGLLADLYWLQFAGVNPAAFLEKYKDRIEIVHLKDMKIIRDGEGKHVQTFAEVFGGNMDYGNILDVCKKTGVRYAAVEQDVCPADPFDSLKISFDNIKARGFIE